MKRLILIAYVVFSMQSLFSQNVGIGTSGPAYKLDVRNGSINTDSVYRINGGTVLSVKGTNNTFVGFGPGNAITTGQNNTAVGLFSFNALNTGSANASYGSFALSRNESGSYNTGLGTHSLFFNISSQYNTAVGYNSGGTYNLGWNNTIIGAEADVSFNGQFNSIALGNITICPDNSTVRIGNSANWSYGGYANWTNISDGLYKKNIQENVKGLEFIMKLRPITYQMKAKEVQQKLNSGISKEWNEYMKQAYEEKEAMVWTGFVAQEVEAAAKETGFEFSGVDKPRRADGVYGLRYSEFVVPLVKAVQELSKQNEELITQVAHQKKQMDVLLKKIEKMEMVFMTEKK